MTVDDIDALADAIVERLRADRDERPLLSPAQVAERLGLSARLARELIGTGRIASFKVEGSRKVEPAEVDRYLAVQKARSDG